MAKHQDGFGGKGGGGTDQEEKEMKEHLVRGGVVELLWMIFGTYTNNGRTIIKCLFQNNKSVTATRRCEQPVALFVPPCVIL